MAGATDRRERIPCPLRVRGLRGGASLLSLGIAAMLLTGGACSHKNLRTPREVSARQTRRDCELCPGEELSRKQAICVAGLAGLRVQAEGLTVRETTSLSGQAIWVVEEPCTPNIPDCLAVSIRKADGRIVNRRFLFLREIYPADESRGNP
jgi:hypothetical protein